jgi:outer membrane receptor protein involved in Fe transport
MRWITRSTHALCAAVLCSVLVTTTAGAQGVTTGAITGRVTGEQGQPLDAAEVRIVNRSTGYATGTTTRATGLFLVQGLEVGGPYSVTVRAIGYQPYMRDDVYVRLSEATRVDAMLAAGAVELAGITATGTVTADFSPTRQGVGTQISETYVQRLPTFSRDFIDLLKLSPQVVYGGSGGPSGGGAYNRFNTFTIDGANQSERFNLNSTGGVPGGDAGGKIVSLEAVKEFRVSFTPSDVRQGNFAGMLVNAVTRSGTNEFHGGANYATRNNGAVLGLDLVGKSLLASDFNVKQYGFYIGGPILRDRLHFFVAPEWQQRTNPVVDPTAAVPADSITAIANIMQQTYGFDVGTAGSIDLETPLTNLFGRIDFQISSTHRLVLREIYNRSNQDNFFRDLDAHNASPLVQTQGFRFGSQNFAQGTKSSSTVGQLYSNFGSGLSNELIVGYNTIRAERIVPVAAPEVSVGVNVGTVRAVTFGAEQFSPFNQLDQDIFEVVNNLSIPMGRHTVTVGGRLDHSHILNRFPQGLYGVYKFPSIAALQAGTPNGYAVGYPNSGRFEDIAGETRVRVYSLYGQDQWSVNDRLTLTAGLRGDIPNLLDTPSQNDTLTAALAAAGLPGVRTDAKPKTRLLLSPRVGVNYDPTGDQRNQIRGSLGVFSGPPPYVQLINAYQNTGLGLVRLSCTGAATPAFTLDVTALPTACAGQSPPPPGQAGTVGINLNDPNFKFPQYLGLSAGFDRQLPYNTVLTVEAMYRKAINGVLVRDANLRGPRTVGGQEYTDRDGRVLYADTISATGSVTNNSVKYLTTLRGVAFSEGMIQVTNQSKDYNYSISAQLNRRFSDRFAATVAYTYLQSKDVQSLTSDRAISNWRFGRQLSTSHDDLTTTTSNFERPHRFVAYGTYTLPWGITDVTLYYEGVSGLPFVYIANDDLNGDGSNGNDPIYVPRDATDPTEIQIGTGVDGAFVQNQAAAQAFNGFIDAQPCLNAQRGRIMERNSCRSPFQHRIDLSIRQSIPRFHGQQLALQLDIFNVLNMLGQWFNEDWGVIKLPTLSPTFNNQAALDATGRNSGPLSQSIPTFTFDNRLYDAATGNPKPFEGRTASVYQIQLTLKYTF